MERIYRSRQGVHFGDYRISSLVLQIMLSCWFLWTRIIQQLQAALMNFLLLSWRHGWELGHPGGAQSTLRGTSWGDLAISFKCLLYASLRWYCPTRLRPLGRSSKRSGWPWNKWIRIIPFRHSSTKPDCFFKATDLKSLFSFDIRGESGWMEGRIGERGLLILRECPFYASVFKQFFENFICFHVKCFVFLNKI